MLTSFWINFAYCHKTGGIFFQVGGFLPGGDLNCCCVVLLTVPAAPPLNMCFPCDDWLFMLSAFDVTSKLIGWNFCNGNPVWEKKIRARVEVIPQTPLKSALHLYIFYLNKSPGPMGAWTPGPPPLRTGLFSCLYTNKDASCALTKAYSRINVNGLTFRT